MKLQSFGLGLLAAVAVRAQEEGEDSLPRDPVLDLEDVELAVPELPSPTSDDPEENALDDLADAVSLDDAIFDGEFDIYRGKGNKKGSSPADTQGQDVSQHCSVNPSSLGKSGNNYELDKNCSNQSTQGKKGHRCTLRCATKGQKFYYSDGSKYNLANVSKDGSLSLSCDLNQSNQLGWNVDYNYFSLKCFEEGSKAVSRPPAYTPQSPLLSERQAVGEIVSFEIFQNLDLEEVPEGKSLVFDENKYEFVNNGQDMVGKFCNLNKKTPKNGELNCNNKREGDGGPNTIPAKTKCDVSCFNGFDSSNTYTEVECFGLREIKSGKVLALWSQKKKAVCNAGNKKPSPTDPPVTKPTKAPTPVKTKAPTPVTQAPQTQRPSNPGAGNGVIQGYFPSSWHEGKNSLDTQKYFDLTDPATDDMGFLSSMSTAEKQIGHKQILPKGKCAVCTNARNMKKCISQNKTCDLRRGEVCYAEIKKDGADVLITRGCQARRTCMANYFLSLTYNGEGDMSQKMTRPREQCRYMSQQLSQGLSTFSQRFVVENKACYSCHGLAFSVPYL